MLQRQQHAFQSFIDGPAMNTSDRLQVLDNALKRNLRSMEDLRAASVICRELIESELDAPGAFLTLAMYFETLERVREGNAIEAEPFEADMSLLTGAAENCIEAIKSGDI